MGRVKVAEFGFIASRSFLRSSGKSITVPARFYKELRKTIETETTKAEVDCGNNVRTSGSIYWGSRAGGRYFQVRIHSRGMKDYFESLGVGIRLKLMIVNNNGLWEITLEKY